MLIIIIVHLHFSLMTATVTIVLLHGDVEVDAVRNDETSLTCQILQDDVCQHMDMLIEILFLLLLYNIPAFLYHKFTRCRNQYCLDWPIRFETYY